MRRRSRLAALLPLATLLLPWAGCASVTGGAPNPFFPQPRVVTELSVRDGYLDATLSGPGRPLRFFFPPNEACAELLRPEAQVGYVARGRYGQVVWPEGRAPTPAREGEVCVPLGVGSLTVWRDRQPRPRTPGGATAGVERDTARFRVMHRDDAGILLRGRFPLAGAVGFANADDLVAFVPASDPCLAVIADGQATLEYRESGPDPFRLMTGPPARCVVEGFAIPPAPGGGG